MIPFTYPETSTTSATATPAVNVVKSAEWLEIEEVQRGKGVESGAVRLGRKNRKNTTNSKKTVHQLISHSIHGTIFTYMILHEWLKCCGKCRLIF